MIEWYDEDREFKSPDEEPHNEGILLFSDSRSCYDDDIENILEDIKSGISGYGNTIEIEPHGDGLDLMEEDAVEAEEHFLVNSLWIIHHECILDSELKKDFRFCIQHTPPQTMILIWIDGPEKEHDEIEADIEEAVDSGKVEIVKTKKMLTHLIERYLGKEANPKMGKEKVIAWNNNVWRILDMRC